MNRYARISSIEPGRAYPLRDIAQMLVEFIDEAAREEVSPQHCPAIMLLGSLLAFHCHTDVSTEGMIPRLMQRCAEEAAKREIALSTTH